MARDGALEYIKTMRGDSIDILLLLAYILTSGYERAHNSNCSSSGLIDRLLNLNNVPFSFVNLICCSSDYLDIVAVYCGKSRDS